MKFSHAIKRGRGHRDLHAAHQFVVVELLQECLCYAVLMRLVILPSFLTTWPSVYNSAIVVHRIR